LCLQLRLALHMPTGKLGSRPFALDPSIPYAWPEPASVIELPAMRYGRINVLGFMRLRSPSRPLSATQN